MLRLVVLRRGVQELFQVFLFRFTFRVLYSFQLLATAADATSYRGLAEISSELLLLNH